MPESGQAMIVTLTGSNSFLLKSELDKLVDMFVKKYSDMGLEKVDGEEAEFQQIYDALTSLPFLASNKLVVLRNPSANKDFVDKAETLLTELPEITDVIIAEPKLDKRTVLYKFLKQKSDFREFNELDATGLVNWLVTYSKSQKGTLSAGDARFLVERVGANQQLLKNEIDKLLLYESKVTHQTIELLTEPTPQSSIFNLLDAAFAGNAKRTLELYAEQRAMKIEPPQIIAMLAWQLHVLAIVKKAGKRTPDEIAREAKINPFVVRKSASIAQNISLSNLKSLISNLLDIDIKSKTTSLNTDEALQNYLLKLAI